MVIVVTCATLSVILKYFVDDDVKHYVLMVDEKSSFCNSAAQFQIDGHAFDNSSITDAKKVTGAPLSL